MSIYHPILIVRIFTRIFLRFLHQRYGESLVPKSRSRVHSLLSVYAVPVPIRDLDLLAMDYPEQENAQEICSFTERIE